MNGTHAVGPRSVAIVIPAYQAAVSVGDVVRRCRELPPRWGVREVLVVDDGSTDGTADAARAAGARVLRLPVNRGKGNALAAGFADLLAPAQPAGSPDGPLNGPLDGVITVDADGQHLPEEIPRLLETARDTGADLVLGTREHIFADMCRSRRLSNQLSSRAISWLAGCSVCDAQTGFRYYSASLLGTLGFPAGRFEAESAIVVRAARRGFPLAFVPVRLGFADGRCTSHYRPLVDSLRICAAVTLERWVRT